MWYCRRIEPVFNTKVFKTQRKFAANVTKTDRRKDIQADIAYFIYKSNSNKNLTNLISLQSFLLDDANVLAERICFHYLVESIKFVEMKQIVC